jgi:hypothetical protein
MAAEIEVVRTESAITPLGLIQAALSKNVAPEVLKELVALQQSMVRFEWEAQERQSRIDFDNALNECQAEIERITPNVKRNDTSSWWADYAQLDRTVRPIYTGKGFSIAFSEEKPISEGKVRIKATLSRSGVSKEFFKEIMPSTTGPKGNVMATATDADAIANSRAKRYLILAIFNIAVGIDADEKISPADAEKLEFDLKRIRACQEPGELQKVYTEIYKVYYTAKNDVAMKAIIACKDEEKRKMPV